MKKAIWDFLIGDDAADGGRGPTWWLAAGVTAVFLVIAGVAAWHHEFWRDEMQAWLIARDLKTLPALLEQAHYEGAPPLWSLMLKLLALITPRPEIVQVLNWVLAGVTVFLFTAYGRFSGLQKVLLAGNYYLLFEYGTVCRNYLPGVLGLTVACVLYPTAGRRPWWFAAALVFTAMTSVHALILAVAMAAAFWGARILRAAGILKKEGEVRGPLHIGALVSVVAGVGLAVYSMLPRPDTLYGAAENWHWHWIPERLEKVACALVYSHFPWPRPEGFFWIPPWDTPFPSFDSLTMLVLAGALVAAGVMLFRRSATALIFYVAGTVGVGAFLYLKYLGFMRHTGFLFLVFLFAWWIAGADRVKPVAKSWVRWWAGAAGAVLFTVMLGAQAITGANAVARDVKQPFSCGKLAAAYLVEAGLAKEFIAIGPDWAGAPVAGYLGRTVYYPYSQRHGSFVIWNRERRDNMSDEEFYETAAKEAKGARMVILLDHPMSEEFMAKLGIVFIKQLGGSLTPFEDYYVHLAEGKPESP